MTGGIKKVLVAVLMLWSLLAGAATLSDIQVANAQHQVRITLSFIGEPQYALTQNDKRAVTLEIGQTGAIQGLPLRFSGNNLIKAIRAATPQQRHALRLLVELSQDGGAHIARQKNGASYTLVLTINADTPRPVSVSGKAPVVTARPSESRARNPLKSADGSVSRLTGNRVTPPATPPAGGKKIIIAIDAGHGGQDPGAIGPGGAKEKNVTLAIARKLRTLLNGDARFNSVLTRDGDYFVSVMGRSEVARGRNASFLVSIHADAAPNREATGASVWVLSNRRANSEMANWLEQHEKQSELLGGAGDALANSQADPYLSQAVLDLQFGHAQRVGYAAAMDVLSQLRRVGNLHKRLPEHASLGVLRSPDIPSILVETGFISNASEERLLASDHYQQQIAGAIYNGLRDYFKKRPPQTSPAAQTASRVSPGLELKKQER